MEIDLEKLKQENVCRPKGVEWIGSFETLDVQEVVEAGIKECHRGRQRHWGDMRDCLSWLMNNMQGLEWSIFCARHVLHIFEREYPEDIRPRKAIKAVESYLVNPCEGNRDALLRASASALDAADAADAYAAEAAYAAAHVAAVDYVDAHVRALEYAFIAASACPTKIPTKYVATYDATYAEKYAAFVAGELGPARAAQYAVRCASSRTGYEMYVDTMALFLRKGCEILTR